METAKKILRLAEMSRRDTTALLIEMYAMAILRDADTAGGKLPACSRGIVRDLRGLHDSLVVDAPQIAPLIVEILRIVDPIEDCADACCIHAPDCDGSCDHLPGHKNACLRTPGEAA